MKIFLSIVKYYNNHNIPVSISQWDLFHFHICEKEIVFHSMEYPSDIPNLGFCQKNSPITTKFFNKRNLVYDLKQKKLYFAKNTKNLLYYDCNSLEDRYIDPHTFKTYSFKY